MNNENLAAEIGQMIHNPTDKLHPDTVHETLMVGDKRGMATPVKEEPKLEVKEEKTMDAKWEPVRPKPNYMDKLKACAKDSLLFCALSLLFFYWQQTGQMAMSASMPSICTCVLLCGISLGKHSMEG